MLENNKFSNAAKYKVEFDGQTRELTFEELIELAKKGLDYDRMAEELAELKYEAEQQAQETAEFMRLFPGVDVNTAKLDPVVANYIENGNTLAAAYALKLAEDARTMRINDDNSNRATGNIQNSDKHEEYYTDEQIEAMSIEEIKEKLPEIIAKYKRKV